MYELLSFYVWEKGVSVGNVGEGDDFGDGNGNYRLGKTTGRGGLMDSDEGIQLLATGPQDDDDDEDDDDGAHDDHHLDVLPPVLALQRSRRFLEL